MKSRISEKTKQDALQERMAADTDKQQIKTWAITQVYLSLLPKKTIYRHSNKTAKPSRNATECAAPAAFRGIGPVSF